MKKTSLWEEHARRYVYSVIAPKINLIEDFTGHNVIVDLGCGDGIYIPFLAKKCHFIVAIDISHLRLKRAQEYITLIGIKNSVDFVLCDARHLPLKANSVGLVFASDVLEHFSNKDFEIILSEIERILYNLVATIPNPHTPLFKVDPTHILSYTIIQLILYLSRRCTYSYHVRGLYLPLLREKGKNRIFKEFIRKILQIFPWLSTYLVITGTKYTHS